MRIFGNVQPQSESTSLFLNIVLFQEMAIFGAFWLHSVVGGDIWAHWLFCMEFKKSQSNVYGKFHEYCFLTDYTLKTTSSAIT